MMDVWVFIKIVMEYVVVVIGICKWCLGRYGV